MLMRPSRDGGIHLMPVSSRLKQLNRLAVTPSPGTTKSPSLRRRNDCKSCGKELSTCVLDPPTNRTSKAIASLSTKQTMRAILPLQSVDLQLKFVIAELNNTFNERRLYLFPARDCTDNSAEMMKKDFHVSPSSYRRGSYRLSVTDPANGAEISVTVTLYSSKGHPKLVARLWSIAKAIDPYSASPL